jgi:hypothetical protein
MAACSTSPASITTSLSIAAMVDVVGNGVHGLPSISR